MEDKKLAKDRNIFTEDKKVLEFIEYCKSVYSKDIEEIRLSNDNELKQWQIFVKEGTPGFIWMPIDMSVERIENLSGQEIKLINSRYKIKEIDGRKKSK